VKTARTIRRERSDATRTKNAELAAWRIRAGIIDQLANGEAAGPYVLEIAGDWSRAATQWQDLGCLYESALALALALGNAGDETSLRRVLDELQALGTPPAAAIVARRLRARGAQGLPRGPRRATKANAAGLTTRELEVLTLLPGGMRNAEIARRLVVSERTIDHHVSAILRKLDARTRGEAVATGTRLALIDPI
jgi:DNA-binding CsgD family transcriptional regulator